MLSNHIYQLIPISTKNKTWEAYHDTREPYFANLSDVNNKPHPFVYVTATDDAERRKAIRKIHKRIKEANTPHVEIQGGYCDDFALLTLKKGIHKEYFGDRLASLKVLISMLDNQDFTEGGNLGIRAIEEKLHWKNDHWVLINNRLMSLDSFLRELTFGEQEFVVYEIGSVFTYHA